MPLLIAPEAPPLTSHDDGTIRVTGTRFLLDVLIAAHVNWGWSAEKIVEEYDALTLADVYSVLGYYHRHKAEVDEYLTRQKERAAEIRRQVEARQGPQPSREELLARRTFRPGERVPVSGIWRCQSCQTKEVALSSGDTFPPCPNGQSADWSYSAQTASRVGV